MFKIKLNKRVVFLILLIVAISIPTISALATPHWISVPQGSSTSGRSPNWVTKADGSLFDCDDYWIGFRGISKNKIIPTNKLKIWSTNLANRAHIDWHDGLNGYFECYQDTWCNVFLCGKDDGAYNGWSHRLELLP